VISHWRSLRGVCADQNLVLRNGNGFQKSVSKPGVTLGVENHGRNLVGVSRGGRENFLSSKRGAKREQWHEKKSQGFKRGGALEFLGNLVWRVKVVLPASVWGNSRGDGEEGGRTINDVQQIDRAIRRKSGVNSEGTDVGERGMGEGRGAVVAEREGGWEWTLLGHWRFTE